MQSSIQVTAAGTLGGTLLTVFVNIAAKDLISTALLAAVGALVSFVVSIALKRLFKSKNDNPKSS